MVNWSFLESSLLKKNIFFNVIKLDCGFGSIKTLREMLAIIAPSSVFIAISHNNKNKNSGSTNCDCSLNLCRIYHINTCSGLFTILH